MGSRRWGALVAGGGMALVMIGLSTLLMIRDRTYVRQQVVSDAEQTAARFTNRYEAIIQATERLGEQWINRAGMTETEWIVEADATIRDVSGLLGLAWIDSRWTVRFAEPRSAWTGTNAVLDSMRIAHAARQRAGALGPWVTRRLSETGAESGIVVPLCYLTQCDGYIVGTFRADTLLETLVDDLPGDYRVQILDAQETNDFSLEPPQAAVPVGAPALAWTLVQTPSPTQLAALRSRLPLLVLSGGLLSALLLGVALWFAAVSDEHRAKAEANRTLMAESERRFRATFDSAFQYEWLLDTVGAVLETNHAALAMVPAESDPVAGVSLWSTVWFRGGERAGRLQAAVARAAAGDFDRYEETLDGGEGREDTVVDLSVKPICDDAGEVVQVLCEGRNITERRQAENALLELEALSSMGRMAARVAHEINNPLAGIRNAFLLLKDAVPTDHPHHRFVGAIEREIGRIAGVTRQLYETYRPDQERQTACAIGTVLADVASLLHQVNRDLDVTITVDAERLPGTVQIPEAVIRQVAYNLIQNAAEASGLGGTVEVSGSILPGRLVELTIRDSGPGVPPELQERIFEPFYSTKTGLTTGGMGLGLALVKRSIEALGGTVTIESGEQGGAVFRVRIPEREDTSQRGTPI